MNERASAIVKLLIAAIWAFSPNTQGMEASCGDRHFGGCPLSEECSSDFERLANQEVEPTEDEILAWERQCLSPETERQQQVELTAPESSPEATQGVASTGSNNGGRIGKGLTGIERLSGANEDSIGVDDEDWVPFLNQLLLYLDPVGEDALAARMCRVTDPDNARETLRCWDLYSIRSDIIREVGSEDLLVLGVFEFLPSSSSSSSEEAATYSWEERYLEITEASEIRLVLGYAGATNTFLVRPTGSNATFEELPFATEELNHRAARAAKSADADKKLWRLLKVSLDVKALPIDLHVAGRPTPNETLKHSREVECWSLKPSAKHRTECWSDEGAWMPFSLVGLTSAFRDQIEGEVAREGRTNDGALMLFPLWQELAQGHRSYLAYSTSSATITLTRARSGKVTAKVYLGKQPPRTVASSTAAWSWEVGRMAPSVISRGVIDTWMHHIIERADFRTYGVSATRVCMWSVIKSVILAMCRSNAGQEWNPLSQLSVNADAETVERLEMSAVAEANGLLGQRSALAHLMQMNLDESRRGEVQSAVYGQLLFGELTEPGDGLIVATRSGEGVPWDASCRASVIFVGATWSTSGLLLADETKYEDCSEALSQSELYKMHIAGTSLPSWNRHIDVLAVGDRSYATMYKSLDGVRARLVADWGSFDGAASVQTLIRECEPALFEYDQIDGVALLRGMTSVDWRSLGWRVNPMGVMRRLGALKTR